MSKIMTNEQAMEYCRRKKQNSERNLESWVSQTQANKISTNSKPPNCDNVDYNQSPKMNSKHFYPDTRMSFGGKKLRRKTSKKSHRKSSKKQRKSRRGGKSRRGRR